MSFRSLSSGARSAWSWASSTGFGLSPAAPATSTSSSSLKIDHVLFLRRHGHLSYAINLMEKPTQTNIYTDFLSCFSSCHSLGTSVQPISLSRFYSTKKDVPEDKEPQISESYLKQFWTFIKGGINSFSSETKLFYRLSKQLWKDPESIKQLSRQEIDVYSEFSKDLPTFGLIVVVLFVPMAMTICLPLMLLAPQYTLSHHFWTQHQKVKFGRISMRSRLQHMDKISVLAIDSVLQHDAGLIKEMQASERGTDFANLFAKVDPNPHEILSKRWLFEALEDTPLKLDAISPAHLNLIIKMNSLSAMSLSCKKTRLVRGAMMLHYSDLAMQREGIMNMTDQELAHACVRRGLHPENVTRQEMMKYLTVWVQVSSSLQESSISLLLHLPVLLGHNAPSNIKLLESVS